MALAEDRPAAVTIAHPVAILRVIVSAFDDDNQSVLAWLEFACDIDATGSVDILMIADHLAVQRDLGDDIQLIENKPCGLRKSLFRNVERAVILPVLLLDPARGERADAEIGIFGQASLLHGGVQFHGDGHINIAPRIGILEERGIARAMNSVLSR